MENKKKCFKCLKTFPKSNFYAHKMMGDGLLGKCKDCARKDSMIQKEKKMLDPVWAEKEKERLRVKERNRLRIEPEKVNAKNALRLKKFSSGRNYRHSWHWHHWSYLIEHHLDVIKLDPQEHRRAHRFMVYDRERFQYRRADTMELLDTRERHEAFLKTLSRKPL